MHFCFLLIVHLFFSPELYGFIFANEFAVWIWSLVAFGLIYSGLGCVEYSMARKYGVDNNAWKKAMEAKDKEDVWVEIFGSLIDLSFKEFIAPAVIGTVYFSCVLLYLRFALGELWDMGGDYGINIALNLGIELDWKYLIFGGLVVLAIIRVSMEAAIALIIVAQNTSDIMNGTADIANTLESNLGRPNITGDYPYNS